MTVKTAVSPAYEALLADLNTMAKAIDVNQERIAAGRSAEGHMQSGDSLAKSEEAKKKEKEEEERKEEEEKRKKKNAGGEHEHGKEEHMSKSFVIETEGGQKIEVTDASDLLKSLTARFDGSEKQILTTLESVATLLKSQGALIQTMTERMGTQAETIGSQETLIKSMRTDLDKLGSAPGGRKAVVTVAERQAGPATDLMAKAGMPEGVTVDNFFAKAFDLQKDGKLTGTDIAIAEANLNSGQPVPQYIVQRVLGGAGSH
jgi:hypothetical protein